MPEGLSLILFLALCLHLDKSDNFVYVVIDLAHETTLNNSSIPLVWVKMVDLVRNIFLLQECEK